MAAAEPGGLEVETDNYFFCGFRFLCELEMSSHVQMWENWLGLTSGEKEEPLGHSLQRMGESWRGRGDLLVRRSSGG